MKKEKKKKWIAILDFGSQYTQLIARRVREAKVYSEIVPYYVELSKLLENPPKGIILSGGPASVYEDHAPLCDKKIFELGIPILGICYGAQLIAQALGGKVANTSQAEYGRISITLDNNEDIFYGFPASTTCWMSHQDLIEDLPMGFKTIAHSNNTKVAAIENKKKMIYGVQFHPEVTHTPSGKKIFENFLYRICQCQSTWNLEFFSKQLVEEIKNRVGEREVVAGVSGGIDSLVAAVLTHKAIGNQLHCIFINNGLLRKGEVEEVQEIFRENFKIKLNYVDASDRFLKKLKGINDPETKRKIIGEEFIRVFEEVAKEIGEVKYLLQGTLYPDVIESISLKGPSSKIKSHHNVGGLPEEINLKVLEPLKYLFKDEVRKVAKKLKFPDQIIWRQPFPGPGLSIRVIGPVEKEKLDILREADEIIKQEIIKKGLYKKVWQSFGILLPVKSVGVMGDSRTYDFALVLRIITSNDGMTADWAKIPYTILEEISNRIINEVKGVNRVVYDISSKPPATIEWE
ncbi:MAG: glutamine-hydrolyzing GMP synthase [Candidatus Atribacteria bacterium]|nr:glutamine-hydrolyzing GMP synthase [Candidatus Atribacteria bacterium]MCK4308960.1 glutamine-hydrolyzing GMP synthase [Candidatus Atribacteria bacterium]